MTEKLKLLPFDMAEHLTSPEAIAKYLTQVGADGDPEEWQRAIGHVAKAYGIAKIAAASGLGRESLYKALAPGAKPRHETTARIMQAMGMRTVYTPA